MRIERYFYIAKEEAIKSNMAKRHGCLLVKHNKIIAKGYNTYNQRRNDCYSRHAEVSTIMNCDINKLRDSILYVVRIGACGNYKLSKPCNRCNKIIQKYGIKTVIYS